MRANTPGRLPLKVNSPTFYLAGSFRSRKATERHARWVTSKPELGEFGFVVRKSSDYAGLRPGYYIVVDWHAWQFDKLADAYRQTGWTQKNDVDAYTKRILPIKKSSAE